MQPAAGSGRFAPSPSGELHLGNLRTALLSWVLAVQHGLGWLVRVEDLDPVTSRPEHVATQVDDLRRLGLPVTGPLLHQSRRFADYAAAIEMLDARGLVYECFCTRREIREATQAPNGPDLPDGAYPGTCRELGASDRRRLEREGRRPALRLRTDRQREHFDDLVLGRCDGLVDDVVLRRNDGVPAYNLAVVVDDAHQGVTQVVRADDLASSTPRQLHLQRLLGLPVPAYAHVPLVLGPDGTRLAKRHGAVSLADLADRGIDAVRVVAMLARSVGVVGATSVDEVAAAFDLARLPRAPWRLDPRDLSATITP